MSTRTYVLNFLGAGMLPLPQGRFFMIKSAPGALSLAARRRDGQPVEFTNVGAGLQYNALETLGWYSLEVTSALAQVVEIVISDEASVTFANAVSVTGVTQTQEQPFATPVTPADVSVAAGGNSVIPANPARRAVRIGSLAANADAVNLRVATSAAARGSEIQAGMSERFATTASLTVFNGGAVAQSYWTFEET